MDTTRFDALIRLLATTIPRRTALYGLAGSALTALLARAGWEEAGAKQRKKRKNRRRKNKKKTCKKGQRKCNGRCIARDACCPACGENEACLSNGSCAILCETAEDVCPLGCPCAFRNTDGFLVCTDPTVRCSELTLVCTSTSDCPPGQHCQPTFCNNNVEELRCIRLCGA